MRAGGRVGGLFVFGLAAVLLGCPGKAPVTETSAGGSTTGTPYSGTTSGTTGTGTTGSGTTSGAGGTTGATDYARNPAPNPIVVENQKTGDWDWYIAQDANAHEIEGYASDQSVEAGERLDVMVSVSQAHAYTYNVFRIGYYGGVGARKVLAGPTLQGRKAPACPTIDVPNQLVECDWPVSFSLNIPQDWVSGLYLIKLHREDGPERYVPFVVRDHRAAEILMKAAFNTDQAYNRWGGESLYHDDSHTTAFGRAHKVSFNRPYDDGAGSYSVLWWEQHLARFLERNGYDVSYGTNLDVYRFNHFYDGIGLIATAGHDEYWSVRERQALDAALASGQTSVMNLSANPAYWRVRFEPDSKGRPNRTMVCFKNEQAKDPALARGADSTARFRDDPNAAPENGVFGTQYQDWMLMGFPLAIGDTSDPLFNGTGFVPGDSVPGLLGYEYDNIQDNGFTPPGTKVLMDTPLLNAEDWPSSSQVVVRTTPQGREVFSAGTIYWPLALSSERGKQDTRIWKLTWNVIERGLAHRHAPRPPPNYQPAAIRADPDPVPRYAKSIAPVAGTPGVRGYQDGPASSAKFVAPTGLAVANDGTIFVADSIGNRIRMIQNGMVSTYAGTGVEGHVDGPGNQAMFGIPVALAIGPDGALYVADSDWHCIRRIANDPAHTVSTYAGVAQNLGGYRDGPGNQARFNRPTGLAFGADGTLYVTDEENALIRAIAPDAVHTVTTFAGTWTGFADGPLLQAAFNAPAGITRGPDGTLYILDAGNARIRRIKPNSGTVETIVGTGLFGFQDGRGDQAMIRGQLGILWMPSGVLWTDSGSHRVRQLLDGADAATTQVTTFAGDGRFGTNISTPDRTNIVAPAGIAVGPKGELYVSDSGNGVIRTLVP